MARDQIKGFSTTVFHCALGAFHLKDGAWVDPDSKAPLSPTLQKCMWKTFCKEHHVEMSAYGHGPDDGLTGHEI